jgi:hypothetical protein
MGAWSFSYDTLDRLTTSTFTSSMTSTTDPELPMWYTGHYGCWCYDSYGKRLSEAMSASPCTTNPPTSLLSESAEADRRGAYERCAICSQSTPFSCR